MKNPCLDAALQELSAAGVRDVTKSFVESICSCVGE
jgi:hypothetical protein